MVACKVIVDDNGMSGRIDSHRDLIHAFPLVDHCQYQCDLAATLSNLGPLYPIPIFVILMFDMI